MWRRYLAARNKSARLVHHQTEHTRHATKRQCCRDALPLSCKPAFDPLVFSRSNGHRIPFLRNKVRRAELVERLFGCQCGRVSAFLIGLHKRV